MIQYAVSIACGMHNGSIAFIIIAYHPEMESFGALVRDLSGYRTIVIDNGMTLAQSQVGKATLLSQTRNRGFATAANIGIHYASARGTKWFVILNQDFSFARSSIPAWVKTLKTLPPCVAGPFSGGLDPKRWTTMLPSDHTDYLTGSCIAIHERVVRKIGYFYTPYFLYYEDADFCVRAKNAGFPLTRVDVGDVSHEESMSLGKGSPLHQYYLARNHLLFVRRLAPFRVKLYEGIRFVKTVAEHILRHETGALAGVRDFVLGRFGAYAGGVL